MIENITVKQIEKLRGKIHPELVKERQIRGGGTSSYIPHQVFTRVMTDALGFRWSWEIIREEVKELPLYIKGKKVAGETKDFVALTGRLNLHGLGSWDASVTVPFEDEESFKKADTSAFRKACDRAGIGYQTWDAGILHDEEFDDDAAPATEIATQPNQPAPQQPTPQTTEAPAPAPAASKGGYSEKQIAYMQDIKKTYHITDNNDLLKLVKAWDPDYQGIPRPEDIDPFIEWVRTNPTECENALM